MSSNSSRCSGWKPVTGTGRNQPASKGSALPGDEEPNVSAVARVRAAVAVARRARFLRDVLDGDGPVFELWVSGHQAEVRGECDQSVAETLEERLATLDHRPTVVVDLSGVTFL